LSAPASDPILICFDRSDGSRRAIEAAGAQFPGRKAVVLHVWSPIAVMAAAYGGLMPLPSSDEQKLQEAAEKLAAEGAELAAKAGLEATSAIAEATFEGIWHTVIEAAKQHGCSVIVIGARGLSTFKSVLLGSVSHGVAQHAHVPVLIVPPAA
jgi:nucleotide-binding universal stress UspA family protein